MQNPKFIQHSIPWYYSFNNSDPKFFNSCKTHNWFNITDLKSLNFLMKLVNYNYLISRSKKLINYSHISYDNYREPRIPVNFSVFLHIIIKNFSIKNSIGLLMLSFPYFSGNQDANNIKPRIQFPSLFFFFSFYYVF